MIPLGEMRQRLQSAMSVQRYIHTEGVAETAKELAARYGVDEDRAYLAGLLHDCAKDFPDTLKRQFCKEYHIPLDKTMKAQIDLVHPFLGAEVARREYEVDDAAVLDAIRYHTTGRPAMSDLEKILYIADYIEPNRKPLPEMAEARRLAYTDLDAAMAFLLKDTIDYVRERGRTLHPLSLEAYDYYLKREERQ